MSYELLGRATMAVMDDLSSTEVTVLIYLCAFANAKTGQCNPSQSTLASRARLTRRSAVRALNGLEEKGYIERKQNFRSDGGATSCSYIINLQKLPEHHPASVAIGVTQSHRGCDTVSQGYDTESQGVGHSVIGGVTQCHTNQELESGIELKDKPPLPPKGGTVAKARKQTFDPKTMTTPDTLNADAWNEWIDYRVDKRKPVTQVSAKKQVAMLAGYSFETQQQMVDASIANGWQGLFPPKVNGNQLSAAAKTQRDIDLMQGSRLLAEAAMRQALKRKN